MLKAEFFKGNRERLYKCMVPGTLVVFFSGELIRRTADENYPYFANRNFIYLTGIEQRESVVVTRIREGSCEEELYMLPLDPYAERWTGARIKPEEAEACSAISEIRNIEQLKSNLYQYISSGEFHTIYLDFDRQQDDVYENPAIRLSRYLTKEYPYLLQKDAMPLLKKLRLIKQACEIEAMEKAEEITKAGILAMMQHSSPGMYEYQYKAEYDYALAQYGVSPGFASIISAGKNNFCIHYDSYRGQATDGDMILNDVGVRFDHVVTDVSRGWPCNGKFSEKQRLLYECAYRTSEYAFSVLKPGIPMTEVDQMIRKFNYEQLKEIGLCKNYNEIGTYMWHGGAHHVGFDVHDVVALEAGILTSKGMVFCVDVGIYCEEWGIGFRLEDNCLITADGCRNLSAGIPRKLEDIESVMA